MSIRFKIYILGIISIGFPGLMKAQCVFNFTPGNPCPGESVTFTISNPVPGAVYTWDLDGDGQFDDGTGTPVTFIYPYNANPVNFVVALQENNMGCGTQTVAVKAGVQPTIGVTMGGIMTGKVIRTCSGGQPVNLGINNTTPNSGNITGYTVNWGDGSPVETHTNASFSSSIGLTHNYTGAGFKTITITATHVNGCVLTNSYQFFNGGNPDIGLSSIGNTNGLCAPDSLMFNVQSYQNNPAGTTYQFYENDQPIGPLFVQGSLPNPFVFIHLFAQSSCGETTPDGQYENAFSIKIVAKNPCGEKAASVQPITASSKPNPDFSINAPEFCPDRVVTFTNTTTNINEFDTQTGQCIDTLNANWVITPGTMGTDWVYVSGGPFNFNQIQVRFITPGTYTVQMTLNPQPACGPATITKSVTILEPPEANALAQFSNPNGCLPLTVNFNNQSTGYQISYNWHIAPPTGWSWQPGGGTNDVSIENPTAVFTAPGDYMVTLTVTNVCATSTWVQPIEVKDRPAVTLPALGPFCQSATLNFTAPNTPAYSDGNGTISSYNWTFPGGMPTSANTANPTGIQYGPVSTATTFTYTATVTNECGSNSATGSFDIQVPVSLTVPPDITVCANAQPFQLNPMPGGGTWSAVPAGGVTPAGLFTPANSGGPGVKTLTYSYGAPGSSCTASATMTVTVVALPVVDVPVSASVCVSETVFILNSTPASGGVWTSSPGGVIAGNTFDPSVSGPGTYLLTYTYTDANGCSNSDQMTLTVNALPVVTSSDISFCNNPGLVSLPAASPAGGIWSGLGVTGNQFDPQTPGGPTFTATYSYISPQTNCTNTTNITITVTNPDNVNAGADLAFCLNANLYDLNSDATPSSGGIWSGPGVNGNLFDPMSAGVGLHTLQLSIGAGNCQVVDSKEIRVHQLPQVAAGPDISACVSETSILLNSIPASGGGWTSSLGGQIDGNEFNPSASGAGAYTLTYDYTDANGCSNSDQMTLTVNALPVVTSSDISYCITPGLVPLPVASPVGGVWSGPGVNGNEFDPQTPGGPTFTATYSYTSPQTNCTNTANITITVTNPDNVSAGVDSMFCINEAPFDLNTDALPSSGGIWSGPGVSGNSFDPMVAGAGLHNIQLSTGTGNCLVTDIRQIRVHPLPIIMAGPDLQACISNTAILLSPSPVAGVWSSTGSGQVMGNIFNPSASGSGAYTLNYTYTDGNGCSNADSLVMVVHPLPLPFSSDTIFCNTPGLVPMPYATPAGGSWSGMGNSGFNFDPVGAGGVGDYPHTYSYTDLNGCTDSITIQVRVIEPVPAIAGPNDTLCVFDGLLQLQGFSPATGGKWFGDGIIDADLGIFDPLVTGGGLFPIIYSYGVGNCEQHDTANVLVIAVNINAGSAAPACLDDNPITLSGFTPATGGSWTGTGITNPSGQFDPGTAEAGNHVLSYTFVDPILGCTFRDSFVMTVNPMPESDFAPPSNTCINELVVLQNLSASTFQVLWDFGDGVTSNLPTHTYTDTGTYLVTLTTINEFGCTDMASRTIFVTEPPFAFFTPAPDTGCAVLPVSFQNESYGWQTSYQWDIGNLYTDTLFTPAQILLPGGTKDTFYIITLTATNLCAVRIWTDSILVHPLPLPHFGTHTDTICSGETIFFANTSLGQPENYWWDFGNGQVSTDSLPNPVMYFTDSLFRTYTIRLIASNFCGIDTFEHQIVVKPVDVKAFFNVPNLIGCQPYTVPFNNFATPGATVSWQFGDGNTSSDPNPQHTYVNPGTYKVIQKATAGCGFDSTISYITVLPAPIVSFTSLPQICRNDTLQFTNTSPDPLSGVRWNFGNGDTSILNNPQHAFGSSGLQTVTFTGISAVNGCPGIITGNVNVLELPIVQFSTNKPDGCVPLSVTFQIQPQGATYFEWDFGDGNTQIGAMATHVFTNDGQYEVRLLGIDVNGCRNDTLLRYITVHPIPSPIFTMQRDILCGLPVTVDFINQTPDAGGFYWTFGDGTGVNQQNNPQHSYTIAGDYDVQLIAENAFLCRDTVRQIFSAYAQPIADFAWTPEKGCAPLEVRFDNLSSDDTSAKWFFTDGGQSDSFQQTTHTFFDWGKHGATLIASHREVCFDTLSLPDIIEVYPSPTANFSFQEINTDPPSGQFEFMDLSAGAVRWLWDFGDGSSSEAQHPSHRYYSNGPKEVKLTVWGENGCPDDTILVVTPRPMYGLYIPNAMTPGLDNGEASIFQPKGVGLREFEIAVYSSYGQLLWTSGTAELRDGSPGPGWDGTYKGNPMAQDVFTWQVIKAIFEDGSVWDGKRVGSLTLIR